MFSNPLIVNILTYLDNNLYCKIEIKSLEKIFHYNKDYIMRVFKKEIGCTIIDYINKKRIYNSLDLLANSNNSLLYVSIKSGFYSLEYYSETFHKYIGVAPSIYKKYKSNSCYICKKDINSITINVTDLFYFFKKIEKYCNNIMPSTTNKILSIFK